MALDRREGRNVHLYHNDERHNPQKQPVGGLVLTRGITKSNFYSMTDILFDGVYYLQDEERTELDSNSEPLLPGNYYVSGKFVLLYSTRSFRARVTQTELQGTSMLLQKPIRPVLIRPRPHSQSAVKTSHMMSAPETEDA